jgi:uncharacterized membrane protein
VSDNQGIDATSHNYSARPVPNAFFLKNARFIQTISLKLLFIFFVLVFGRIFLSEEFKTLKFSHTWAIGERKRLLLVRKKNAI